MKPTVHCRILFTVIVVAVDFKCDTRSEAEVGKLPSSSAPTTFGRDISFCFARGLWKMQFLMPVLSCTALRSDTSLYYVNLLKLRLWGGHTQIQSKNKLCDETTFRDLKDEVH